MLLACMCCLLRSAIFTWIALQQAADLPMEPSTAARLQHMLSQPGRNSLFAMLFRPPRLDSSSGQEQQAAAAAAERGSSSSPTEQQGLVQYAVAPATGSAVVSSADLALGRVQQVSSAGAAGPATIPRGSLEGQGSAEVELELAAGAALHNVQQPQQQVQQQQQHGNQHQQ
jgi:hypothetical protein